MIGIYARVSTAEQAREGYSIDEQVERLKLYCISQGRSDFREYVDPGYSGANIHRPAMQELLRDVAAGKIDKVLVYKLDRLSRSQKDTLELIEDVFLANSCDFESMTERFDTGTSFGRAMVGILAVFAQLEREQIKERMSMGKAGRAKEGRYHGGGHIPYGYDYKDGELVVNEDEARLVREVFRLYLEGATVKKIEKVFYQRGYRARTGADLCGRTIKRILSNSIYVGKIKYKGLEYDGSHEHLISDADFEKVQERMRIYYGSREPSIRQKTVLGGLIYCARCGAKYACTAHDAYGNYRYYTCYSRRKVAPSMVRDPNCKNKNYRVDDLDEVVFSQIRKLALDPEYLESASADDLSENDDRIELVKSELKKIDEQCSRFLDLYGLGKFTMEQICEKTDALQEYRKKLEAELEELEQKRDADRLSEADALELVSTFDDVIERGDTDELRLLVSTLIERIEIDGDNVFIHWRF